LQQEDGQILPELEDVRDVGRARLLVHRSNRAERLESKTDSDRGAAVHNRCKHRSFGRWLGVELKT
jgi:hypothetical protein